MNNVQIRWILAGSLLLALSACEVHVGKCDKDDAGECVDLFPDDEDAGDEEDAGLDGGRSDAGKDGGGSDGGKNDAGVDGGAGGDGGEDAGPSEPLTLEEFCTAQYSKALAWRTAIGGYCDNELLPALADFLARTFAFPDDAVGGCVASLTSSNITFDGLRAAACADAFASQYDDPPTAFDPAGIDLSLYTSTIGHGAAQLVQLPECRAALKGKLARDARCKNSLECLDGLRCLPAPGDTKACQDALTVGVCERTSDCADGLTCVGSEAGGGKTCIPSDDLPGGGNCTFSVECAEGKVCNDASKCVERTPDVICAQ